MKKAWPTAGFWRMKGRPKESLALRLGKDRATIANMLRLLKLPTSIQQDLMEGRISMGHARSARRLEGRS